MAWLRNGTTNPFFHQQPRPTTQSIHVLRQQPAAHLEAQNGASSSGNEPGAYCGSAPLHGVVVGEDKYGDEYRTLNVFPGLKIKPIATPDPVIASTTAISMLDKMLGLLTQDNDAQMRWLKQFVAWIAQHPEIKPQVCLIIISGQGIGKSLFGDTLMPCPVRLDGGHES